MCTDRDKDYQWHLSINVIHWESQGGSDFHWESWYVETHFFDLRCLKNRDPGALNMVTVPSWECWHKSMDKPRGLARVEIRAAPSCSLAHRFSFLRPYSLIHSHAWRLMTLMIRRPHQAMIFYVQNVRLPANFTCTFNTPSVTPWCPMPQNPWLTHI